ncbi:adenylyltransferase/cytidyltransferase family protein [Sporofaciens sp. SGI.106]|uniref:adenylyltransferase/cytidyltransferase family protein n=1 Tax=Sporofaciens sp. SGI.106 TaxID=3420568 RepID=UPI002A96E64B|nr:adenylyltransferase/cytidyltransferase family protein [Lachnoclostridium sp.]
MKKVITYGTYDLLHYGHIRLLERARALGDYLIVGVTADDFDKTRGKINGKQSLIERIEAVRETGLADEIIVEEYQGQKIDDIRRYGVDIFAIGSDWEGKFDYLKEYCQVVYLPRTEGVSSSELRSRNHVFRIGIVGESAMVDKFVAEVRYVNGAEVTGVCNGYEKTEYEELLNKSDAVYVVSNPKERAGLVKRALLKGKHVLCESPVAETESDCRYLMNLAEEKKLILMEAIKTAYATAYHRLCLLAKGGVIGKVVSVEATCTSMREQDTEYSRAEQRWGSLSDWGPIALLPVFQMLGTNYLNKRIVSWIESKAERYDAFTKIDFLYQNAVGSIKVGKGVKSEGILVITGTKGYIYVPAPWWKTDYFEVRYENPEQNKRYFYQLDGEGIRYEILEFLRSVETGVKGTYLDDEIALAISSVIEAYNSNEDVLTIENA